MGRKLILDGINDIPEEEKEPSLVTSKEYDVKQWLYATAAANVFLAEKDGLKYFYKIANEEANNDLMQKEIDNLILIKGKYEKYFPQYSSSFIEDKKLVIVSPYIDDLYSIEDILREYPDGVKFQDFGWMFNRILESVYFVNKLGFVNGMFLPHTVFFQVKNHGIYIADWSAAVPIGDRIKSVNSQYYSYYPDSIFQKQKAYEIVDLHMAAECGNDLIGDDANDFVKELIVNLTNDSVSSKSDQIRINFGEEMKLLFGKKFFKFEMSSEPFSRFPSLKTSRDSV